MFRKKPSIPGWSNTLDVIKKSLSSLLIYKILRVEYIRRHLRSYRIDYSTIKFMEDNEIPVKVMKDVGKLYPDLPEPLQKFMVEDNFEREIDYFKDGPII